MTSFCGNCGAPAGGQGGFCGNCGAAINHAAVNPAAMPVQPPAVSPATGGSAVKIALIVVGVLFVFGAIAMVGAYYAGRRLVRNVQRAAGVPGISDSIPAGGSMLRRIKRDGCALLSKSDAEAILGTAIERVDGDPNGSESGEHCDFYVKPGTMEQDEAKMRETVEEFKAKQGAIDKLSGSNLNEQARKEGVENLAKSFVRSMASSNGNGDVPVFSFSIDREQGKSQFGAFRTVNVIVGSAARGANETLSGLGDRALMGPMDSMLCVLKGNTCITLNLTQVPNGREKGVALARKILSRL